MKVLGMALSLLLLACVFALPGSAAEDFSFDLAEFEKKPLEWGGYAELKGEYLELNTDGALYRLNFYQENRTSLNRLSPTLQLDGSYKQGITTFSWVVQGSAQDDEIGWQDKADIFEGYGAVKLRPGLTLDLGKKVFRWGKGYAWNPVGFIDREKDPNDPEQSLEGYIGAGLDLVRSFSGPVQTMALTSVALPVWQGVNEDFGEPNNVNLAAKLYLLYRDIDIDFICYTGNSRSSRYGIDFSKNLAINFEVHGELAHIPGQPHRVLLEDNSVLRENISETSFQFGLRYLSASDVTTIVEYYHNDDGYSEEEQARFSRLAHDAYQQYLSSGSTLLLDQASDLARNYSRPQVGRNYLYLKTSQKEPFGLLYFTPGLTAIFNLDDQSYTISPEAAYTGLTNWQFRLRFSYVNGGYLSEQGEKPNRGKLELRGRYFF